jgi:serine/threonine-protein kinase
MGVVYEAEDTVLARTVAVKTIELAFDPAEEARNEFEQRFFTEARAAARLAHPGIVVCHDVGKDPASGKLFIVFEHLKGRTLAERAAEGPMDWRNALAIVVQVARAIHHAHEHGVVHRDLKPANVMLLDLDTGGSAARADAAVKIMDFGFARLESLGQRLTRTGQSFGTPLYMSPEQALGQRSDPRSDIFSLGSVLCTLLLGRPWFEAPSLPQIVRRLVHDDPPHLALLRPDLPASLDAVLGMALAKSAEDRYASAADMADDLEDVLAGRSASHALLAGPTSAAREPGSPPPPDLLEAFLEDLPLLESASNPGARAAASATQTVPARVSVPVTSGSGRRWLLPGTAVAVWAVLAFVVNRALAPPVPTTSTTLAPVAPTTTAPTAAPVTLPSTAPATAPTARPRAQATAMPLLESPTPTASNAGVGAAATSSTEAAKSRIRLSIEHPFENGRLIVWIDGVLVYEMKLQAPVSKRVVGVKVREGRAEKLLDLEPGRHEVRVEVTWEQDRRVSTKVVDVASGSTGLLEVRVGRMSKDLRLEWSRLAKE